MTRTSKSLLLCTLFSIVFSFDASLASTPVRSCFKKTDAIFQMVSRSGGDELQKYRAIVNICQELGTPELQKKYSIFESAGNLAAFLGGGLFGDAAAAFNDLGGSEVQNAYINEIRGIRSIPDPMKRIELVYQLAVRYSGKYADDGRGWDTIKRGWLFGAHRPSNLLEVTKETGSIGVCREYAALLAWSLLQVARHPSSKRSDLGPLDFGFQATPGQVPGGGHVWLRVRLPQFDSNQRISGFLAFDLDTTWYAEFTPLYPRRTGMSEAYRQKALEQCSAIQSCMEEGHPLLPISASMTDANSGR